MSNKSKIVDFITDRNDPFISLELCPGLGLDLEVLSNIKPVFCSVACLNKNQQKPALFLVKNLTFYGFTVLLHLPGQKLSSQEVLEILELAKKCGVRNILALQGDSSQLVEGNGKKCDFSYASHLVRFIRDKFGTFFCIAVAGYPQIHPKSPTKQLDLFYLKEKCLSGADLIITQGCFDFTIFRNFVQDCRNIFIDIPVISGVFLLNSWRQLGKIVDFCCVPVKDEIVDIVYKNRFNDKAIKEFGLFLATNFIKNVFRERGNFAKGVHVFSMSNFELVSQLVRRLGFVTPIERPLKLFLTS